MKRRLVTGLDLSRCKHGFTSCIHLLAWIILGLGLLLPALKAHAVIGRDGRRPPFKEMGANPFMAKKIAKAYQARHGLAATAPVMTGDHPVIYILIENSANGAAFNDKLRDAKLWQARIAEMKRYWTEVSVGRLNLIPAKETEGTANDGVIGPLTVPEMGAVNYENNIMQELQVIVSAVRLSSQYINYASYDKNNDKQITADELHLFFIFAGYEASWGGTAPAPSNWAHQISFLTGIPGLVPATDSGGMNLTSYLALGAQLYGIDPPAMAPIGGLCHEFGHDLGLPDLYDSDYAGSGGQWNAVGVHSLMCMGSWTYYGGGLDGSMPTHLDGWCKSMLGWANETVIQAPAQGTLTLPAAEGSNAVVRVNVPNSQEYFIIENRQHTGYDRGIPGSLGGLLILHCDDAVINGPMGQANMLNADPMNPGIKVEEASGLNRLLLNLAYEGGDDDFYRVGNATIFNEMTNPSSNRKNGQPSMMEIFEVSPTGQSMTFKLGRGTPQMGFARTALSVSEANRRLDLVVNLSKKSDNIALVDYKVIGGTATGAGVDYTMADGTVAFYPGETSKYITMLINNDSLVEINERVQVALSNARGAMVDNRASSTTVTILDNDNPYLNLLKPNGGEKIARGTRFLATWNSDVAVAGRTVSLALYKDGNYYMTLAGSVLNATKGSYNVLFPASLPVGFNYRLAVISNSETRINDQSDDAFSIIDPALKVTSLAINNGAVTSINRQVTLNNRCGGSPVAYMASESASFSGASWKAYSSAPLFVLTPGDATKRVYFKVKNAAGQESAVVSDTIVLKEALVKPVIKAIANALVPEHQVYSGPAPTLLAGNTPVIWSLINNPAGMKINPATGVVTWPNPVASASPCQVTLRAYNKAGYGDVSWKLTVESSAPAPGLDCTQLTWTAAGNAGWFSQRQVTHDGVDAARSQVIGNGLKAGLTTTLTGPGVFSFWWKVSSERNYDKLGFYFDGNLVEAISGEVAWVQKSVTVPAGRHTITFLYAKDAVGAAGADAGYVDQVVWTPGLMVSGLTRAGYSVQAMAPQAKLYSDRATVYKNNIPALFNGQILIQTSDADRLQTKSNLLSFSVSQPVTAILAIDSRFAVQPWWAANWKPLQARLETSEGSMKLYAMRFPAGKITLGGNCNPGPRLNAYRMYSLILIPSAPVSIDYLTKSTYSSLKLHAGLRVFADGNSFFADPVSPLFWDESFIRTRNSDRNSTSKDFLSFNVNRPVMVVLALDSRRASPPSWAADWQLMADPLAATNCKMKLYVKRFMPGRITLGGNLNPGQTTGTNMYSVIVLPSN